MAPPAANPFLTYIAIGFGVIVLVQATFLPNLLAAASRRQMAQEKMPTNDPNVDPFTRETGKLAEGYQKHLIITAAPLEGGIFFLLIAYSFEGSLLGIIGAIVLLVFLGSKFPTRPAVERWIEQQRDLLQQERMGV